MAFSMPFATWGAQDGPENPDQLIAHDADSIRTAKYTLITGQNVKRGTVLGRITASGKLTKALSASGDGSQNPFVIAQHDVDATSADQEILCYTGGSFNAHKLILGTGITAAACYDAFRALGITLELNPVIAP